MSDTPDTWDVRLAMCRERLAPAAMLVGEWIGEGQAHGEPVTGRLSVRAILGGTALEVWERTADHEDLCIYRWDPDVQQLEVIHLMEGQLAQHPVELTPDSMVWVTPPGQVGVVWTLRGESVVSEVIWPGQRVAEVRVTWRRA